MATTFDDGIVKICEVINIAENGFKPKLVLKEKTAAHFGYETVGVIRFIENKKVDNQIEEAIRIYQDRTVRMEDIAVIEDVQFKIVQAQHKADDDNIKITVLSLERINEEYDYI